MQFVDIHKSDAWGVGWQTPHEHFSHKSTNIILSYFDIQGY